MAFFTEEAVKANLRVKDGKRVFYMAEGDRMTPSARSWLRLEGVEILPAETAKPAEYRALWGAILREKPEHMTHLRENILVPKDHPRIRFRGAVDALEAEILWGIHTAKTSGERETESALRQVLSVVRELIPCDVLGKEASPVCLGGLSEEELRAHSHFPQKYYNQPHFMPTGDESETLLALNKIRTTVRQTETVAFTAFYGEGVEQGREDILQTLNRLSSYIWILMIRLKAKENGNGSSG